MRRPVSLLLIIILPPLLVLGSVDRRSYLDYFSYALQWPVPCRPLHITAVTLLNAPLLAAGRRRFVPAVRILAGDGAVLLASDFAPAADADHPQAVWLYCGALAVGCGGRGCLGLPLWPQSGAFWAEPGSGDALHLAIAQRTQLRLHTADQQLLNVAAALDLSDLVQAV